MQTQVGWRADSTSGKARLGSCPWWHKAAGPGPPWARSAAGEPAGDSPQGNGSPRAAGKKSERAAGQGKARGAVLSTPRSFSSGTRVTSALLPSRVGQSGFSRETWPAGHVHILREKFVLRDWLVQLWGVASPTFVGQAGRLEIRVRADVSVLDPKAGSSGGVSAWRFGGGIPSSLRNLSGRS